MANYFQNGLLLHSAVAGEGGMLLSRWVFEFATQVCGMAANGTGDAKWTNVIASGSNGAVSAGADLLDIPAGHSFTVADKGKYLTLTGMTDITGPPLATRDGIYIIADVVSATQVRLDILRSVHEVGLNVGDTGINWRLWDGTSAHIPPASNWAVVRGTYTLAPPTEPNFDVYIATQTAGGEPSGRPTLTLGPYGTWNGSAWTDARNTSAKAPFDLALNAQDIWVWACGDSGRLIVYYTIRNAPRPYVMYFGDITANYPTQDEHPSVVVNGGCNSFGEIALGHGQVYGANRLSELAIGLAYDDATTTAYWAAFPHNFGRTDNYFGDNYLDGRQRRWSEFAHNLYRQEIMLVGRTALFQENRGVLRDMWIGGANYQSGTPFGTDLEYFHYWRGLSMPWNGSKSHRQLDYA